MSLSKSEPSKLNVMAKINYSGRILGNLFMAIIICAVLFEGEFFFAWFFVIFQTLLWPHIAFQLCKHSKDSKKAEYRNLLIDSIFFGLWVPVFSFQIVPSCTLIISGSLLNNAFCGGFKWLVKSIFFIVTGILSGILLLGHVEITPESSLLVTSISLICTAVYIPFIGLQGNIQSNLLIKLRNQLMEARKKAEMASEAKSEFLANMSHEIRTPMNGIIGATELAMAESITPEVSQYLNIISNSGQTLLGIINDILDFSKIEAGKLDIEIIPTHLSDIIINIGDIFSSQTSNKGVEFLFDIEPEIPLAVHGDPTRIKQILSNLVSNAVKFTNKGDMIIAGVKALNITDERVLYEFFVKDTGKGMKKEYLDNLFEAFTQEDASTTRQYGGTGLGMSICKLLVNMMNGEIRVESQEGAGTTFFFTLDLKRQPHDQERKFYLPEDIPRLKVMIIDDSKDNLNIMQKIFNSFGCESLLFQDPKGVESIFENNPFDLVITDWKMPEINGIELARRLRKIKPEIPIIMLTAFGQEAEKETAKEVGIKVLLTKPINAATLYDAVMLVFGKGHKQKKERQQKSVYQNYIMDFDIHILLAEDNLTNQAIARAILKTAGIKVDIANNGLEVLDMVKSKTYNMVLMDIQMPEMDGYEATIAIRKDKRFATLPIIAMTAHAMKGIEDQCRKAGMNGYISKPIRQDVLFRTLWKKLQPGLETAVIKDVETVDTKNHQAPPPETLSGINVSDALSSLGIDWMVYKTVLQGFRRNNLNIVSQMISAFDKNNSEILRDCAHSLKGSAANIRAEKLADLAQNLENSAKNNTAGNAQINDVKFELEKVFTSILSLSSSADNESDAIPSGQADPESAKKAINNVIIAIKDSDPEQIKTEFGKMKVLFPPSRLTEIENQLADYNFDRALEMLKKLREEQ